MAIRRRAPLLVLIAVAAIGAATAAVLIVSEPGGRVATASLTYYVSSNGSDANSGTSPSQAWRTVAKVNAAPLHPGDAVLFQGGETFTDSTLQPVDSGTQAAPIVFGSYGQGQARITHGVYFFDRDDLSFEDLALGPTGGFQGGSTPSRTADHIVIEGCTIGLSATDPSVGIYSMGDSWVISDNTISQIGNSGMLLNGSDYTITGNTISYVGLDPAISYAKHGIYLLVSDATVAHNHISHFQADGISARRHDSTILDNTISAGSVGISFYEYDATAGTSRWTGNVISGTTVAGIYVNGGSGGVLPTHESFVISHNTIRPASGVTINLEPTSGTYRVAANTS